MVGRLPVQAIASLSLRCRCTRAVCPQSRRTTAAGPCCRRSCSCMSPQRLGGQADSSQPPLPDPASISNQASTSTNTQGCADQSRESGEPGTCTRLQWWRLSWCYIVPYAKELKGFALFMPRGLCPWWQDHSFSSHPWWARKAHSCWLPGLWTVSTVYIPFLWFWSDGSNIGSFEKNASFTIPSSPMGDRLADGPRTLFHRFSLSIAFTSSLTIFML